MRLHVVHNYAGVILGKKFVCLTNLFDEIGSHSSQNREHLKKKMQNIVGVQTFSAKFEGYLWKSLVPANTLHGSFQGLKRCFKLSKLSQNSRLSNTFDTFKCVAISMFLETFEAFESIECSESVESIFSRVRDKQILNAPGTSHSTDRSLLFVRHKL